MDTNNPFIKLPAIQSHQLKNLNVGFFLDISGSTSTKSDDHNTVLDLEKNIVRSMSTKLDKNPIIVAWNDKAYLVDNIDDPNIASQGGTDPSAIFRNRNTKKITKKIDVAVIITDGEINITEIKSFGESILKYGKHLKAIVGIIVSSNKFYNFPNYLRTPTNINHKPSEINVSVLVPAMISNGCIIYHNSKDMHVVWSSGSFKTEWNPPDITESSTWEDILSINTDKISEVSIPACEVELQKEAQQKGYISFGFDGTSCLFFNPEYLLTYCPTWDQLMEFQFDRICQYFSVSMKCEQLLDWFKDQYQRFIDEFMIDSQEKEIIDDVMSQIRIPKERRIHNQELINTFIRNRDQAIARRYIGDEEIETLIEDPRMAKLVQFFKIMMQTIEEDSETQNYSNSYTTLRMTSNRYTSYHNRSINNIPSLSKSRYTIITANFDQPYKWFDQFQVLYPDHNSSQIPCSVCIETQVPFIIIRKPFSKNNIDDIMKRPIDYYYPQIVCYKCADYFCSRQIDPVRVECMAAFPIVNLKENFKNTFINCFSLLTDYSHHFDTLTDILSFIILFIDLLCVQFSFEPEFCIILKEFRKCFEIPKKK